MTQNTTATPRHCQICGTTARAQLRPASLVRPALRESIEQDFPHWDDQGWICLDDIQKYQQRYVSELLKQEKGELTQLENEVIEDMRNHELIAKNPMKESQEEVTTFGERLADRIAAFGGSWRFIISFAAVMAIWMILNIFIFTAKPFDPYPFILLNLALSALAALQAPMIMMSQNRQEVHDRIRAQHDYQVNLKAELEIRQLHQKIDHLLSHQWERLLEIQEIQIELIQEIRGKK